MLMCGKSGVGRRSAVSIVSALHQAKWINLKMGKKYYEFFLFNFLTKGQIKPKADWHAIDCPKKLTNKTGLFAFLLFTVNKTNFFVRLFGENLRRAQTAFGFI